MGESDDEGASERLKAFDAELEQLEAGGLHGAAFAELDAPTEHELREVRAKWLGPQGSVTLLMKRLPELPAEHRRQRGQRVNAIKRNIEECFERALQEERNQQRKLDLEHGRIDVSWPGRGRRLGGLHPLTRTMRELTAILGSFGFEIADGPEVDLYEYNFDKLGFPPDHPATDMQDSFFVRRGDAGGSVKGAADVAAPRTLLRTHTSTVQVREMLRRKPPFAVIAPGAVYRRDDDVTHSPMFFQLEGLLVDEDVNFAELKGVLSLLLRRIFGDEVPVRFRPSYFPFVEPGGEVDIGRDGRWMEILGCGMVHPVVFEQVGYDARRWRGFAFGMGIDRITMLKYGIRDIRLLYGNDWRFLAQF